MIVDELRSKQIEYHKAGDTARLEVLRYLLAQVKNKEIELRPTNEQVTDEMVFKIIRKQVKNRKEAIELYERGKRQDLVEKESAELLIWREFAKLFPFELDI